MSDLLISVDWLVSMIEKSDVKIFDGSWNMPGEPAAKDSYNRAHIPGAFFFDIDEISLKESTLPHMAPAPLNFKRVMESMGIFNDDHIIIYDQKGFFSAARVWWTFKLMGHDKVSILDGGLPLWIAKNHAISSIIPDIGRNSSYTPAYQPLIAKSADVRQAILTKSNYIFDARPKARFLGHIDEPRSGLRRGAMPGAMNLFFQELISDGKLRSKAELIRIFSKFELKENTTIITTCGSGVTAAILTFALIYIGRSNVRLYDGSWAEWGDKLNDAELFPVVTQKEPL